MFTSLMTSKRFAPLFWTQFFSAFNDNFLKNALVFLILFKIGGENSGLLITLAGAVFIAPFFFLSSLGGELADRFDKALMAQRLKLWEIPVAALAVVGFWLHSIEILFLALLGFGVIASLFGPIKYGILPDHLKREEVPAGNALVEAATFIAILSGTIVGGIAASQSADPASFAVLMIGLAIACYLCSRFIPATGEAAPDLVIDKNIARSTGRLLGALKADPRLWWGGIVVSWFWLFGAVIMSLLPTLVKTVIGGNENVVTLFLAIFSIAIAAGSGLASYLSHGKVRLGIVLAGGALMGILSIDLALATWGGAARQGSVDVAGLLSSFNGWRVAFDLAGLAISGGLFIVPSFAAVQLWAGADRRARVVASVNVLNAAFMVVSALAVAALQAAGLSPPVLILGLGVLTLAATFWIRATLPDSD